MTDVPEWRTMRIQSRGSTEATISNLMPGREYELMVLSQDSQGDGMFSKAFRARTQGICTEENTSWYNKYNGRILNNVQNY